MDSLIGIIRQSLGQYTPGNWLLYRGSIDSFEGWFMADFCLREADGCKPRYNIPRLLGYEDAHTDENKKSLHLSHSVYATKLDRVFYNL